jgi:hypothetical protein
VREEDQIDMMHDSHALWQEIDRLRADLAQRTAERDALKDANACLAGDAVGLRIACAALKAERDEARREACELLARSMKGPMEIAADRGWNCFDAPHATDGRVQNGGA